MATSSPPTSGPAMRAPRLLLVDDDPMVLRALRRLLLGARPSWEIDMAESGSAAGALLDQHPYDVVVTDLQMPVSDGATLLARLKSEHPSVMRVIHSSHVEALTSDELHALSHAAVTKPGRPDELVTVLDWALEQRRRFLSASALR